MFIIKVKKYDFVFGIPILHEPYDSIYVGIKMLKQLQLLFKWYL